jgi:hypothetical protein
MTCDSCRQQLDDFIDRVLPLEDVIDVRQHLATCGDCRSLADDLATIRWLARSLPAHVPPAWVWQAVAQQTHGASRHPLAAFLTIWRPAVATAMSVALITGLAWVGGRLTDATARGIPDTEPAAMPGTGFAYPAESSYTHAIARLETLAHARRSTLQPAVADVFDSGLTVIDAAIDQSRAALQAMPDSDAARQSLLQALRTKVALLQDTLALATDPAAGEPAVPLPAPPETTP